MLGISKTATAAEVRRGYHKKALSSHPDKASPKDREGANERFGALSAVYKVLSEDESRKLYDETGSVDDGSGLGKASNQSWNDYFRELFGRVSFEMMDDAKAVFQHSDRERVRSMKSNSYTVRTK